MTRSNLRRTALTIFCIASPAALTGCWSDPQYQAVQSDPTPNIQTLYQRPVDVNNALVVTSNENFRMMWQDLGRVTYLNRPSNLTPEPVPR